MNSDKYCLKLERKSQLKLPLSFSQQSCLSSQNSISLLAYSHMTSTLFVSLENQVFAAKLSILGQFLKLKEEDLPQSFLGDPIFSIDSPIISIQTSPDEKYLGVLTSETFSILELSKIIDSNRIQPQYTIKVPNKLGSFQWHLLSRLILLNTIDCKLLIFMTPSTQPIFELPSSKIACFSQIDLDILYSIDKDSLSIYSLLKKSLLNKIELNAFFTKYPANQFVFTGVFEAKSVNSLVIVGDMMEKKWGGKQIPDDKSHFVAIAQVGNGSFSNLQIFNELFQIGDFEDSEYLPAIYKALDILDIIVLSCTQIDQIQMVSYQKNQYALCKFDNSLRLELNSISHSDNKMRGFIFFKEKLEEEPDNFVIQDFDDKFELKFPISLMILSEDGYIYRYFFSLFREDIRNTSFLFNKEDNLKKIEENKNKIKQFENTFKINEERKEDSSAPFSNFNQPKEATLAGNLGASNNTGIFGSSTNQPTGGILGSKVPQSGGLFGSSLPTGGFLDVSKGSQIEIGGLSDLSKVPSTGGMLGAMNSSQSGGFSSGPNNGLFGSSNNNQPASLNKNEGIFGSMGIANPNEKKPLFDLNNLTLNKDNANLVFGKEKNDNDEFEKIKKKDIQITQKPVEPKNMEIVKKQEKEIKIEKKELQIEIEDEKLDSEIDVDPEYLPLLKKYNEIRTEIRDFSQKISRLDDDSLFFDNMIFTSKEKPLLKNAILELQEKIEKLSLSYKSLKLKEQKMEIPTDYEDLLVVMDAITKKNGSLFENMSTFNKKHNEFPKIIREINKKINKSEDALKLLQLILTKINGVKMKMPNHVKRKAENVIKKPERNMTLGFVRPPISERNKEQTRNFFESSKAIQSKSNFLSTERNFIKEYDYKPQNTEKQIRNLEDKNNEVAISQVKVPSLNKENSESSQKSTKEVDAFFSYIFFCESLLQKAEKIMNKLTAKKTKPSSGRYGFSGLESFSEGEDTATEELEVKDSVLYVYNLNNQKNNMQSLVDFTKKNVIVKGLNTTFKEKILKDVVIMEGELKNKGFIKDFKNKELIFDKKNEVKAEKKGLSEKNPEKAKLEMKRFEEEKIKDLEQNKKQQEINKKTEKKMEVKPKESSIGLFSNIEVGRKFVEPLNKDESLTKEPEKKKKEIITEKPMMAEKKSSTVADVTLSSSGMPGLKKTVSCSEDFSKTFNLSLNDKNEEKSKAIINNNKDLSDDGSLFKTGSGLFSNISATQKTGLFAANVEEKKDKGGIISSGLEPKGLFANLSENKVEEGVSSGFGKNSLSENKVEGGISSGLEKKGFFANPGDDKEKKGISSVLDEKTKINHFAGPDGNLGISNDQKSKTLKISLGESGGLLTNVNTQSLPINLKKPEEIQPNTSQNSSLSQQTDELKAAKQNPHGLEKNLLQAQQPLGNPPPENKQMVTPPIQSNPIQNNNLFQGNQGVNSLGSFGGNNFLDNKSALQSNNIPFFGQPQVNPQQNIFSAQQSQGFGMTNFAPVPQYQFGQPSFGNFGAPNPQIQFFKTQAQQPDHLFGKGSNSNSSNDMVSFANLKNSGNQGFLGGSSGFTNSLNNTNQQNFSSTFMQPRK